MRRLARPAVPEPLTIVWYTRPQRLRDVLGLPIGDGTAQIMKLIIARQRVGRAFVP
jgi:alkylation response protein AidB-like acyl-CoA dehydrogenase